MTLWGDAATIDVAAPPARVWSLVSDVTRMSEWSPVCLRSEWLGDSDGPEVGARFVGHNRLNGARWSRECVVTAADPGREFAFHTLFRGSESTRWRYLFEPTEDGTRVVESYEALVVPRWVRAFRRVPGMPKRSLRQARRGMELTLERLKAAAEHSTSPTRPPG